MAISMAASNSRRCCRFKSPESAAKIMDTKRRRIAVGLAIFAMVLSPAAFSQIKYPAKPIRFIVPFAPGGGSDTYSRLIAQKLNEKFGYTVIVDNRPGAGGNLGAEAALREPADGYTFLVISGSYAVNAILNKPAFDPLGAIVPVVQFTREANALAVGATTPYHSLKDLVADAKKNPGKISYGSPGVGSQGHVAAAYFASLAGTEMVHVPYKGTAATLVDLAGGEIQMSVGGSSTFASLAKAGKIRILGVVSPARLPSLPDVPTFAEQGFANYQVYVWHGLVAAKGTPPEIVGKINADVNTVLSLPELKARFAQDEVATAGGTPAEFGDLLRSDMNVWRKTIKDANIKLE
jgi:tripartite-type tricarboxylate transporter receptor subunit TctC